MNPSLAKEDRNELIYKLQHACEDGNLEMMRDIFKSPQILPQDIGCLDNTLIRTACYRGYLDIVKYLLTSKELKENLDIHVASDAALRIACANGYLDIVKYLLASKDLKEHANVNAINNDAMDYACSEGHIDIVKYLSSSKEIKKNIDISDHDYKAFRVALENNRLDIIKYFIFDLDLDRNIHINKYLDKYKNETVEDWFKLKKLNKSLNNELNVNRAKPKKVKL